MSDEAVRSHRPGRLTAQRGGAVLIVAQRGFQANSRVITSSDEILQDLVNLKR